ncbi:amidohydrolase family protein [Cellulomonas shaoxiangyii]|uniref:amidohydrolase family protein n=1 Tax=Cellulomonas shaoxiangyii TaxID=2566013 RepID=UPI00140DAF90|nr:amidohydrolase family protein [Cellulomonas shaoxiangyii]
MIRTTGSSDSVPRSVRRLDVRGRVVTAGFWNCHVHLTGQPWLRSRTGSAPDLQAALDDMFLRRGFTQVLDLASNPLTTRALVRRISTGELRGPEIVTAGNGVRPWRGIPFYVAADLPRYLHALMPGPATPLAARLVVAAQAVAGAGVTKLFTGSYVTPTRVKPMRLAVARAAASEAHRRGMRVFAHPSNREGTSVALRAGVDALAHVPDETDGTESLLREAAAAGVRVVPTLHMFASTVTTDEAYLAPIRGALRGFVDAGGRVLFGTDVGYMSDRDTRGELEAMHAAGMSPSDLLRSLTVEPAEFMRRPDLGTVEPGMRANLTVLATTEPPTPADLAHVAAVVRDGQVVYERDTSSAAGAGADPGP